MARGDVPRGNGGARGDGEWHFDMAAARLAAAAWPETSEELQREAAAIEQLLLRYDAFDMLGALMLQEMPLEEPESGVEGDLPSIVDYTALLYLKHEYNPGTDLNAGKGAEKAGSRISHLLVSSMMHRIGKTSDTDGQASDGPKNRDGPEDLPGSLAAEDMMRAPPIHTRYLAEILRALFDPFRAPLEARVGFSIDDVLAVNAAVSTLIRARLAQRRAEARESLGALTAAVAERRSSGEGGGAASGGNRVVHELSRLRRKKAELAIEELVDTWFTSQMGLVCSFTADELAAEAGLPVERVRSFLGLFAQAFGSPAPNPPGAVRQAAVRQLRARPFIAHQDRYLCPNPGRFLWGVQASLERVLKAPGQGGAGDAGGAGGPGGAGGEPWEAYQAHRTAHVAREGLRHLSTALGGAEAHRDLVFCTTEGGGERTGEGRVELDGLLVHDGILLLLEAGPEIPPEDEIDESLLALVQKTYGRGLRAARHIRFRPAAKFAAAGGDQVIVRRGDLRQACVVTVTLGPTSTLWAKAYQETGPAAVGAEAGAAQQWAISLFDLRVICDVIESPAQLIHYLRQRTSEDPRTRELDAFGDYLEDWPWGRDDTGDRLDGVPARVPSPPSRRAFRDYIQTQGAGCNPPRPKPRQHIPGRMRELIAELEATGAPGRTEAVCLLLDLDIAARARFAELFDRVRVEARAGMPRPMFTMTWDPGGPVVKVSCFATEREAAQVLADLQALVRPTGGSRHDVDWLGLLTIPSRPRLVQAWALSPFMWVADQLG